MEFLNGNRMIPFIQSNGECRLGESKKPDSGRFKELLRRDGRYIKSKTTQRKEYT